MEVCIQSADLPDVLGFEKGYSYIREAGFTAIDWNLDHAWKYADLIDGSYRGKSILEQPLEKVIEYYAEELAMIRKNGLKISQAHAPFPAYIPGRPDVLEYAIEIYIRLIEYCDYAGCENLIVHGISLDEKDTENTFESIEKLNMHLYESLIPTLLRCNVTVCLENLMIWTSRGIIEGTCTDPAQAVSYIDRLNARAGREVFGLCLDIGHLNIAKKDFRTYIPALGKRIKTLHIHDNNGMDDLHMSPFTGNINWAEFCDLLHQIGYEHDLDFETFVQQNRAMNLDEDLLKAWLKVMYETGVYFRKRIAG